MFWPFPVMKYWEPFSEASFFFVATATFELLQKRSKNRNRKYMTGNKIQFLCLFSLEGKPNLLRPLSVIPNQKEWKFSCAFLSSSLRFFTPKSLSKASHREKGIFFRKPFKCLLTELFLGKLKISIQNGQFNRLMSSQIYSSNFLFLLLKANLWIFYGWLMVEDQALFVTCILWPNLKQFVNKKSVKVLLSGFRLNQQIIFSWNFKTFWQK